MYPYLRVLVHVDASTEYGLRNHGADYILYRQPRTTHVVGRNVIIIAYCCLVWRLYWRWTTNWPRLYSALRDPCIRICPSRCFWLPVSPVRTSSCGQKKKNRQSTSIFRLSSVPNLEAEQPASQVRALSRDNKMLRSSFSCTRIVWLPIR